jgi:hypothetical protein
LKTLSDAAPSGQLRLGWYGVIERPDGYQGLAAKYGLIRGSPRVMDLGLLYRCLQNNQVDIVVGSNATAWCRPLTWWCWKTTGIIFPRMTPCRSCGVAAGTASEVAAVLQS